MLRARGRRRRRTPPSREPLPGRHGPGGRDPLAVLARLYPADHAGRAVRGGRRLDDRRRSTAADLAAPALPAARSRPRRPSRAPGRCPGSRDRLRLPDGCPWDREQTHESLRNHLLEEAYEVYDALGGGATPALAEELGDLLLQVVLHAQLAAEEGVFDLTDVNAAIAAKIVRRHPHVFGDAEARTARDVNRQWERIKADERAGAAAAAGEGSDGTAARPKGALDGVSRLLPALAASQEMQERAANIGYDWPDVEGVLDKVVEELAELRRRRDRRRADRGVRRPAVRPRQRRPQAGDRGRGGAPRPANDKFRRRFASVERLAAERGVALRDLGFEELDALWDAAKAEEKETAR